MEEEIYFGKYVFLNHITQNGEEVLGGKLEKMSIDENNTYKILFKELYVLIEGGYKLVKKDKPILKNIPLDYYVGITPGTKKEIDEFYFKVNEKIEEITIEKTSENVEIYPRYKELGNDGNNFYSHGTKIGFVKN